MKHIYHQRQHPQGSGIIMKEGAEIASKPVVKKGCKKILSSENDRAIALMNS